MFFFKTYSQKSKTNQVVYKLSANIKKENSRFDPKNLEFELTYNDSVSIYKVSNKLNLDDYNYKVNSIIYGGNLTIFSDNKKKVKIINTNYEQISYNIIEDHYVLNWTIKDSTKTINGFKCLKATAERDVINKAKNTTRKEFITAWFTSEIPTTFGPKGLNGLPGLILEETDGTTTLLASSINFNIKNNEIKQPACNKTLTYKEFDDKLNEDYIKRTKAK